MGLPAVPYSAAVEPLQFLTVVKKKGEKKSSKFKVIKGIKIINNNIASDKVPISPVLDLKVRNVLTPQAVVAPIQIGSAAGVRGVRTLTAGGISHLQAPCVWGSSRSQSDYADRRMKDA